MVFDPTDFGAIHHLFIDTTTTQIVMAASFLVFTAGIDAHVVNIARNILLAGKPHLKYTSKSVTFSRGMTFIMLMRKQRKCVYLLIEI